MKIRNGYVSNSSSSSFIAFVPRHIYDGVIISLPEETRRIMSHFPPKEMMCVDHVFCRVVVKCEYGELMVNESYVESEDVQAVFPHATGSNKETWEFQKLIQEAADEMAAALPEDKILYFEHND